MIIDTHAHLYFEDDDNDIGDVVSRAQSSGVCHIINVGISLPSTKKCIEQAQSYRRLSAAAGIHPHNASEVNDTYLKEFESLLAHPQIVAVGEAGLDYYRMIAPQEVQKRVFREQIELAIQNNLPLIVHSRDAADDTLSIVQEYKSQNLRGVFHCFDYDDGVLTKVLDLGFYVSFAGQITFKNAARLRSVAKATPLDRLLLETDCPFLTPHPFRGKRNEPAYIVHTLKKQAELHNIDSDEAAAITTDNAKRLFALPM